MPGDMKLEPRISYHEKVPTQPQKKSPGWVSLGNDRLDATLLRISDICLFVVSKVLLVVFMGRTTEEGGRSIGSFNVYTPNANVIHEQNGKYSRVWNSISLVSGDDSDLVHYRTEVTAPELNALSSSSGLASHTLIVRWKGA